MQIEPCDVSLFAHYSSATQKARVATEAWISRNGYCLACSSDRLSPTSANTQARDFECERCGHPYELKSGKTPFRSRIVDGAYSSMMRRIESSTTSSFLLLQYTSTWHVQSLHAIHNLLITASAIEQRKPLSQSARRAGWIGCNILLTHVPPEGRIPLVLNGLPVPKWESRRQFALIQPLSTLSTAGRGWAAATLAGLLRLGKSSFTLKDAYGLEGELGQLYPENRHVRAKIRQQLQVLRDAGLLTFEKRGAYQIQNRQHL